MKPIRVLSKGLTQSDFCFEGLTMDTVQKIDVKRKSRQERPLHFRRCHTITSLLLSRKLLQGLS